MVSSSLGYAPEEWIGSVAGHSFSFRERHNCWRIELDLRPHRPLRSFKVVLTSTASPRNGI